MSNKTILAVISLSYSTFLCPMHYLTQEFYTQLPSNYQNLSSGYEYAEFASQGGTNRPLRPMTPRSHTPLQRAQSIMRQLSGNNLAAMEQSSKTVSPMPTLTSASSTQNDSTLVTLGTHQIMRRPSFDQEQPTHAAREISPNQPSLSSGIAPHLIASAAAHQRKAMQRTVSSQTLSSLDEDGWEEVTTIQ